MNEVFLSNSFKKKKVYLFNSLMAALGLCCCAQASGSYSLVAVHGLLTEVASLVVALGL